MIKTVLIILLFVVNIILIRKTGSWKSSIAAGFELTLTGAFLAGYWFGIGAGIWVAMIFMLSSYLATIDISPSMLITIPVSTVVGIAGAIAANSGGSILAFALGGIILHCLISDVILLALMGKEEFLSYLVSDLGHIVVNTTVFRVFF